MIPESLGKILGMAMAYGVSSLGLLLAYYNYRKRIVKADVIFTTTAKIIIGIVISIVMAALIGGAVKYGNTTFTEALPGIIIPGSVIAFAFWVTWMLYVKFSSEFDDENQDK
jgi:predicted membrane protein